MKIKFTCVFTILLALAGFVAISRAQARSPVDFCDAVTEIPRQECEALVTFFEETDGPNWFYNTGWLENDTPCSWAGITCEDGRITSLQLPRNNIHGNTKALAALADIPYLQDIDLKSMFCGHHPPCIHNTFSGNIPPELGSLAHLQSLNLYKVGVDGSIPPQLGELTQLKELNLAANNLTGSIPVELTNLSNLTFLDIGGNKLTGNIPSGLGRLTQLQNLTLGSTCVYMPGIPGRTCLKNNLEGQIPGELGNLSKLETLDISRGQLTGQIPAALGNLTNLKYLYLSHNQLKGKIPKQLGNLTNLHGLELDHNQLSGSIPVTLANSTNLWWLDLNNNALSGQIPAELGELPNLRRLTLEYNQLEGVAPDDVCHITSLTVSHNKLLDGPPCLDDKIPDWRETQTVPPTGLALTPSGGAVTLTWTPIPYSGGSGNYLVECSYDGGATWRLHGATPDKQARSYTAMGLPPGVEYRFRIQTFSTEIGYVWESVYSDIVTGSPSGEPLAQFLPVFLH